MSRFSRPAVIAAIACSAAAVPLILGLPASAVKVDTGRLTVDVTCDAALYSQITAITTGGGNIATKQITTSPTQTGKYHLQSNTGSNTAEIVLTDGVKKSWTSVPPGTWKNWFNPAASQNCNGPLPGDGTGSLTFKMKYPA